MYWSHGCGILYIGYKAENVLRALETLSVSIIVLHVSFSVVAIKINCEGAASILKKKGSTSVNHI